MKLSNSFHVGVILTFILINLDVSTSSVFNNEYAAINGLAFPFKVTAMKNQTIMIKLLKTLVNQEKCILQQPNFVDIDIDLAAASGRITKWDSECSVKIRTVGNTDTGRWKLSSIRGNKTLQGIFTLLVDDQIADVALLNSEGEITISDTEGDRKNITFSNFTSAYCQVSQNKSPSSTIVDGNCVLPIVKVDKNLQGAWRLVAALPGKLDEIELKQVVNVNSEEVEVGYSTDSKNNLVHMYCNLKYSNKSVEFCRFERMRDEKGFNLVDGLGNGHYSYYGSGLASKECGMTIEDPDKDDYGNWRCNLRTKDIDELETKGLLRRVIALKETTKRTTRSSRYIDDLSSSSVKTIISVNNRSLTINKCSSDTSLSYCWLRHPNGTEFPNVKKDENETVPYWYSNEGLDVGECSITLKVGLPTDSGIWTCHMGPLEGGEEITDEVLVRVSGPVAAVDLEITTKVGEEVSLQCVTAEGNHNLHHCRFIPPNGAGLNINEAATKDKPISGLYYFKEGATLSSGECSITIAEINSDHFGRWTCVGGIQDEDAEYEDFIVLRSVESGLSVASVAGLSVGLIVVVMIFALLGYITWQKRHPEARSFRNFWRRPAPESRRTEEVDLTVPRTSNESQSSITQLTINPVNTSTYGGGAGSSSR